ncbi:hypothetical protein [Microbulbifer sp. JMSA008]|uniref:hypothetical protein n=1 Tax=Microbulbifer sp. JMSA008 TaxID=3243373 RepID=UPI004038FB53
MKKLLAVSFMMLSQAVSADSLSYTGKIKSIFLGSIYENKVFIGVDGIPTGSRPAGCEENSDFDFALDLSSSYGREYYSAILAAYTAQKTVRLRSYDSCNLHPSVPDFKDIWVL